MSSPGSEEKTASDRPTQTAVSGTPKPAPVAATATATKAAKAALSPARHSAPSGIGEQIGEWVREEGAWWAASFVFHTLLMAGLMLIPHQVSRPIEGEAPSFEEAKVDPELQTPQIERFEIGETKTEDLELTTESLSLSKTPEIKAPEAIDLTSSGGGFAGGSSSGPQLGGLGGGFTIMGLGAGAARRGGGGVGGSAGFGNQPGAGGSGFGFRGTAKKALGAHGGTKSGDRAVGAALNWIARHQSRDGSWGLADYRRQCKDPSCTGPGTYAGRTAGTALALLPFLAAGQTHETKGPYRKNVYEGLYFLIRNQARSGDLSGASPPQMYVHGLATIVLCEAYGLTHSKMIGKSAQQAILFIQSAQNPSTGGWRYTPGEAGDTSVVGWQVMALKSAQMAGLQVDPKVLDGAHRFLKSCSKGNGGLFSYTPENQPTPSMTSVGLLCLQYGGMRRTDPQMAEGVSLLLRNMPDSAGRNLYYWYYATQVMHNIGGPDWDNWNRRMRKVLVDSQCKEDNCAHGSWDPDKPSRDAWAEAGGRLMVTSLATLTLEVYYRYLPLYKLENTESVKSLASAAQAKPAAPPPPKPTAPPPKPGEAAKSPPPAAKK